MVTVLAIAPSAWASVSATVAPIGSASSGSYLVTVTNTGPETEGETLITTGETPATNVVPGGCIWNQPVAGAIGCPKIAAGGMLEVCYTGGEATGVTIFFGGAPKVSLSKAGPVGSCPVPGFTLPSSSAGSGAAGGAAAGAAPFSFGKAKDNLKKGTAALVTNVPGAGTLELSGKGVKSATANPKAAGPVTLTVKATGKAASKLAKTGKVKVKVSVTFTPAGGSPSTQTKTVKLVKQLAK
jgi:hypothetical protein